ncbi:MAG: FAD/NAD(P)-binding oxidoreductase [Firmicutes bacterium HGW-Firmicutes-7]|nr:MAG: FAD/NAD(P)-binding oxidoreductase [Firmicutes bacterium HGW-Firmicutes-7]
MLNHFYSLINENNELKKYEINAERTDQNVIHLSGEVDVWQHVIDIGHIAGSIKGIKGVVNHITAQNIKPQKKDNASLISGAKQIGIIDTMDVVIVGAGVIGTGIARELAKYDLKIALIEKNSDISEGTTKANNGMIHSGYDSKTGTLKAEMNVKGNAMYSKWAEELNFPFNRTGSFVAGFSEEDDEYLEMYYERGKANGVPGIEIISAQKAREFEPNLHHTITKLLWTPSAGYVEPYEVTEALAENAVDNGVSIMLSTEVLNIITKENNVQSVVTNKGIIQTSWVINAAGLYADEIAEMVGDCFYTIHPRRGTLVLFDKSNKGIIERFIGTPPKNFTKGGGPMQTPEGNPIWGPSAIEVPDKENVDVDQQDLDFIINKSAHLVEGISRQSVITFFSGLRACTYTEDFIIEASEKVKGFIHVSGIQSPGLASAPAIAQRVENIFIELNPSTGKKENFNPIREKPIHFRECTFKEKDELIKKDPKYAHVICRCETITEAEIIRAIRGKIPARTLDAVKRRTRAGMGRCQGGFCGPRVVEIISRELGIDPTEVTLKGNTSNVLISHSRK